jgi:hypothetical protein
MRRNKDMTAAREILTRGAHAVEPAYPRTVSRAKEMRADMSQRTMQNEWMGVPTREARWATGSERAVELMYWALAAKSPGPRRGADELANLYFLEW